jgi:putative phosphoesterase
MLLGVVSDTHGQATTARAAARMLESLEVEAVVHCGDVGSSQIPALFAQWPAHFVLGNVDYEPEIRQAVEAAGLFFHARFADLQLDGRRIAVLHSDDARRFRETIASGQYDLVCYGHTHTAEQHREEKTLVLNPGALHRAKMHTVAIVDLQTMQATIVNVGS